MILVQLVGKDYARYRDAMSIREPIAQDELILFSRIVGAIATADREWREAHKDN